MAREYEDILQGVLDRVPDEYDKREGSVIWEAVAPLCAEIAQMELMAEAMGQEAYIGTATGEYLDRLAKDFGFERELSTPVLVKAELVGGQPERGLRFSSVGLENEIMYRIVQEGLEPNIWYLESEEYNEQANHYVGEIAQIDFINGLESARILEIAIPQKPTETDEAFRNRIQGDLIAEKTDGNVAQYKQWLDSVDGVGKSKVIPLWNGVNTVKCTILNELNTPASSELIQTVQQFLDPNSEGMGEGKAPIGAIVTVDTAKPLTVNVDTTVTFVQGSSEAPTLKEEIKTFFGEIALVNSQVGYLPLASVVTYNKQVDTVVELKINGSPANLPIPEGSVPVLGTLTVNGKVI